MEKILKNLVEQVDQLKSENSIYQNLFYNSPIAIWEEDITELLEYLSDLKKEGIEDFEEYFKKNPKEVNNCFKLIKVVNANNALVKILKAKSKEYLIENRQKVYTKKTFDEFLKMIIYFLKDGASYRAETEARAFDGKIIQFEIAFEIYKRTALGKVKYFRIISLTDITDRVKTQRKLLELENNLRNILDNSSDLIFLLDPEGKILDVNAQELKELKAEWKDVVGTSLFDYVDGPLMAKSLKRFEKVKIDKKEINVIDVYYDRYWKSRLCPIFENDQVKKYILFTREVTEFVKTKEENLKLKEELIKVKEEFLRIQKKKN